MILDAITKLEAVLAGAVSANQPEVHVDYIDYQADGQPTVPASFRTALNSGNDVTILAAPTGTIKAREPIRLLIYNKDTASVILTLKTDDGTTERIKLKQTLLTLETLAWEKGAGYQIL